MSTFNHFVNKIRHSFNDVMNKMHGFFTEKKNISKSVPAILNGVIYHSGFNAKNNFVLRQATWKEGKVVSVSDKLYSKKVLEKQFSDNHQKDLISGAHHEYSYYYNNTGFRPMVEFITSVYWTPPNHNELIIEEFEEGKKPMPSKDQLADITINPIYLDSKFNHSSHKPLSKVHKVLDNFWDELSGFFSNNPEKSTAVRSHDNKSRNSKMRFEINSLADLAQSFAAFKNLLESEGSLCISPSDKPHVAPLLLVSPLPFQPNILRHQRIADVVFNPQ